MFKSIVRPFMPHILFCSDIATAEPRIVWQWKVADPADGPLALDDKDLDFDMMYLLDLWSDCQEAS